MQTSMREGSDNNTTMKMYSVHNKQKLKLLNQGSSNALTMKESLENLMKGNGTGKSSSKNNNMLNEIESVESDPNNISYYEKTFALKKNSVIDKLLIERTLAEKIEFDNKVSYYS